MLKLEYTVEPELLNEGGRDKSFILIDKMEKTWHNEDVPLLHYAKDVRSSVDEQLGWEDLDESEVKYLLKQVFAEANLTDAECRRLLGDVLKDRKAAKGNDGILKLPDAAPELYENRQKPESPIAFYERVWRAYDQAGLLFQSDLRRLDSKLIPAIHTYCSRNGLEAREHLPPPQVERTRKLAKAGDRYSRQLLEIADRRAQRRRGEPDASP